MTFLMKGLMIFIPFLSSASFAALNCPEDSKDNYPAVVKITRKIPGDEFYCTGTIVQKCFVLTASHCLTMGSKDGTTEGQPSEFSIHGGPESKKDLGKVVQVTKFPGFSTKDLDSKAFDVGFLKLEKCGESSMEIDFGPVDTTQEFTVGGYGAVTLRGRKWQPKRKMGKTKINRLDQNVLCTGSVIVEEDGVKVRNSPYCLPVGQDSGSALIQGGKIRGVFVKSIEEWNKDGSSLIRESCSMNLRNPEIKKFIRETLSEDSKTTSKQPTSSETGAK